jgi:mannan endo-1,4-beta-mannosidase
VKRALTTLAVALVVVLLGWNLLTAQRWPGTGPRPSTPPPSPRVGIHIANGRLVEAGGSDLVLRGVNHGYTWHPDRTSAFADIKATGMNAVRVALAMGQRWPANSERDVAYVVDQCKRNRLICVLDAHDTVGFGVQSGAATMAQAVDFWIRVRDAVAGQEDYVILNIADEPFALYHSETWTVDTIDAVRRMRAGGFRHTLMVDAPDWGQDNSFVMRDHAGTVLAADPSGNLVFSVHMYGTFDTNAKVRGYLASFAARRLALVVGEFSSLHEYGNPDEDAIMAQCQAFGIGYLGWSWSGNAGMGYLDMVVDFDARRLTAWGNRFVFGPNGIRATARQAAVYGDVSRRNPAGS